MLPGGVASALANPFEREHQHLTPKTRQNDLGFQKPQEGSATLHFSLKFPSMPPIHGL